MRDTQVAQHTQQPLMSSSCDAFDAETTAFYRGVLQTLLDAEFPFLIGGTYAQTCYTGEQRATKDLDLFIHREHFERFSEVVRAAGYDTELTYPHWLGKLRQGDAFIDIIFSSGNGISEVDDEWFRHASDAQVLGLPVKISAVEEMLWSKAFIMERERYDGADVAHLLHARAAQLDWPRVLWRFGPHWRVLLSHLVLFGFVYPGEQHLIPPWVMEKLLKRLRDEGITDDGTEHLCQGTLLSREQYLTDVEELGYQDGRLQPLGKMTERDIAHWTNAIPGRSEHADGETEAAGPDEPTRTDAIVAAR